MHGASSKHQYLAKKICIPSNSCPEMQVQWNLSFKTPLFRGHFYSGDTEFGPGKVFSLIFTLTLLLEIGCKRFALKGSFLLDFKTECASNG